VPKLKPLTAKQLIVAVEGSQARAFSGVINERTNLGLPQLPGGSQTASLSWQAFLTGSHSARVWVDGPTKQRVALIGELSEAEVVHNGTDVWTYTSHTNSVSHTVLPAAKARGAHPAGTELTPSAAADRALKAIDPSTVVSVDTARRVAGRPAYTLSLQPRDARSTVRKVTIAVDARTFVPLQVQVFGSGSAPAISLGFTQISFHRPSASTFAFHAPKGAITQTNPLTAPRHRYDGHRAPALRAEPAGTHAHARPTVLGSGWTAVLELHNGFALGGGMLQDATTSLPGGARLLHTALVNAVFLPDGRTFVGAVKPAALEHVAETTAH